MKVCKDCGMSKPNTKEFYHSNKTYKDGLQAFCKTCMCKRSAKYTKTLTTQQKKEAQKRKDKKAFLRKYSEEQREIRVISAWDNKSEVYVEYSGAYTNKQFFQGSVFTSHGYSVEVLGKLTKGYRDKYNFRYVIKFEDGTYVLTNTPNKVRHKNKPSVGDLGYVGYGPFNQVENKHYHKRWSTLVRECKDNKITMDPSWLCFNNFMKDIIKDPLYSIYLNNTKEYTIDCTNKFHYSPKTSPIVLQSESTRLKVRIEKFSESGLTPIINDHDEECIECGSTYPFTSEYFTRKHRAKLTDGLQKICVECRDKVISRRYYEKKKYGKILTNQERLEIEAKNKIQYKENAFNRYMKEEINKIARDIEKENTPELMPVYHVCYGCGVEKPFLPEFFQRDSNAKWGMKTICKKCVNKRRRDLKARNKENITHETPTHKECTKCGKIKPCTQDFFHKDNEHITGFDTQCKECKTAIERARRKRAKDRGTKRKDTPTNRMHKAAKGIKTSLKKINQSKSKAGLKTYYLLGCNGEEFFNHLNTGEYTVDDYMKNTKDNILFHIDHIIPKALYTPHLVFDEEGKPDSKSKELLKKCWNYRNLRVFPADENMYKGQKLDMDLVKHHGIEDLLP